MPQIALNNLTTFASASLSAPQATAPGNVGRFDDHLQRATHDGSDAGGSRDDSAPNPYAPSDASAAAASPNAARKASADSRSSGSTAPQSDANPTGQRADQGRDQPESSTGAPDKSGDKQHDAHPTDQTATATAQCVAAANADALPKPAGPPVQASSQAVAESQIALQCPIQSGSSLNAVLPATPNSAALGTPVQPTDGKLASQQASADAMPPSAAPTNDAPSTPTQPTGAEAAPTAAQANTAIQASQPASAVAKADNAIQSAIPLIAAASLAGSPKGIAKPVAETTAPGSGLHEAAGQPKSARSERDAGSVQHATPGAALTDAQAAAVAVAAAPSPTDSLAGGASAGPVRKEGLTAAIDNIAGKSQPPSAGQAPGNTAIQAKDASNAQPATQSTAAASAGEVDRVRFLQRVSSAFQAADEQGGQIRLRLSPPELGSLKLELTVRNGIMTAHVQAETNAARNMLLDHLGQLRDRLADHNIKIDHFDVELTGQSRSGTPQDFAGNANQQQSAPGGRPRSTGAAAAAAVVPAANARRANGQLDVTV